MPVLIDTGSLLLDALLETCRRVAPLYPRRQLLYDSWRKKSNGNSKYVKTV